MMYPWFEAEWQQFLRIHNNKRLGHAYLLSGPQGIGKNDLAASLSHYFLCETPAAQAACLNCRSCKILEYEHHPDRVIIRSENERGGIAVDQIRELAEFFTLRPHYATFKIAIIEGAEGMNNNAANALLKILEEPPAGALLLLTASRPGRLLPTIRSRCQQVQLAQPAWPQMEQWFAQKLGPEQQKRLHQQSFHGGPLSILRALESDEPSTLDALIDVLATLSRAGNHNVAEHLNTLPDDNAAELVDLFEIVVRALALGHSGQQPRLLHTGTDATQRLQEIVNNLNSRSSFEFLDRITDARGVLRRSSGVRGKEVIENLIYDWIRLGQPETV